MTVVEPGASPATIPSRVSTSWWLRQLGDESPGGIASIRLRVVVGAVRLSAVALAAIRLFLGTQATGPARTVQLVCFTVGTATVAAWAVVASRRRERDDRRTDLLLLVVFAAMAATGVACLTDQGGTLVVFPLLAAAGVGASGELLGAWVVAGIAVLAVTISAVGAGAQTEAALGGCLEVVVALLFGRIRRSYRTRAEQDALLLAQAEQLRLEQAQVATLSERTRIAREIHDVLAHSLGALSIQIQAARAVLSEQEDTAQALTVLGRAQRIATEGLDETRRAVHTLRSESRPLDHELAELVERHRETHRTEVAVDVLGQVEHLPPEAAVALLRIAQEALVNAVKHAPGQPVRITVSFEAGSVRLQVVNPLPGSDTAGPLGADVHTIDGGYGLQGMRERLLLLRGTLTATSRAGAWEVTAEVPR